MIFCRTKKPPSQIGRLFQGQEIGQKRCLKRMNWVKRATDGRNLIQVRAMESAANGGGAFLLEHQKHAFSVGRSAGHAHLTGSTDSKK